MNPEPDVGRKEGREEADRGALARAVGADEAEDLSLADGEAQVVDGHEIAVPLREVADFDHGDFVSVGSVRLPWVPLK